MDKDPQKKKYKDICSIILNQQNTCVMISVGPEANISEVFTDDKIEKL